MSVVLDWAKINTTVTSTPAVSAEAKAKIGPNGSSRIASANANAAKLEIPAMMARNVATAMSAPDL